jgi:hypothetical protein
VKLLRWLPYTQEPIDVFRERIERMRFIAFAPLIALVILSVLSQAIRVVDGFTVGLGTSWTDALKLAWSAASHPSKNLNPGYWNAWAIGLVWLLAFSGFNTREFFRNWLAKPSTLFRFVFDLPVLIAILTWVLWCFHLTRSFDYPFLLIVYALIVYVGSRMVNVALYAAGTHVVGIAVLTGAVIWYQPIFLEAKPVNVTVEKVAETFGSLYLGLYFVQIQELVRLFIRTSARVISRLFHNVDSS